ncbi:type VII secretion integral membrane protein EccD [Mycolicibacterium peregrinum]
MTQPVSVLADTTFVAVNVHAGDSAFQCKLHAHTTVTALLPQLREQFAGSVHSEGTVHAYLTAERVEWALEVGPMRKRLDPEITLAEAQIAPGADLYLTHRTRTESYPVLRDDVAEGAAEVSRRLFAVLDGRDTRRLADAALPLAVAAVGAVGIADVLAGNAAARWPVVGVLAALAVMCATIAGVLSRARDEFDDVSASLCVCAYLATAGAALAGVPRNLGIWHLATVGAAVATMVVALWSVTANKPAGLHVGAAAVSACAVLVGALHIILPVSSQAAAAQMVFLSLVVIVCAVQFSRGVGRVLVNYIPTTGEPVIRRSEQTVAAVSRRSTSGVAIEAMLNQEARVITTLKALIGMVAGAGMALVAAAAAGGYFTSTYEWHMFALVGSASVATVAIGRGLVIRAAAVPLMVAGPLAATAYLAGRAVSPHQADSVVLIAGAAPLMLFVLLSTLWAIRAQSMHSPLDKRRLERVAVLAVVAVFPLLVLIMDGWSKVRNR